MLQKTSTIHAHDKMLCIKKRNLDKPFQFLALIRGMRDTSKNRLHCKRKLIIILFEILKDKMINREIKSRNNKP